jgi:hemolysin type calcium-binding protein
VASGFAHGCGGATCGAGHQRAYAATINCRYHYPLCVGTDEGDFMQGYLRDDIMRGFGGSDTMIGGVGNDTMHGGDANDRLEGRLGDYLLNGGLMDDTIITANGADEAYGAAGNDTIRSYSDYDEDFISCGTGNADSANAQDDDNVDGTRAGDLEATNETDCEVIVEGTLVMSP